MLVITVLALTAVLNQCNWLLLNNLLIMCQSNSFGRIDSRQPVLLSYMVIANARLRRWYISKVYMRARRHSLEIRIAVLNPL